MRSFGCDAVIGFRETGRREVFVLGDAQRWLLGSSPRCDVAIADPYVSPIHCALERRDDGALVVRDCGSRNGTIVDESPVVAAELRAGSYLTIGRTTLVAVGAPYRSISRAIDALRGDPVFRSAVERATGGHVLITGEPGTGKRLLAQLVHEASTRGPLVTMRCAAVPRDLAASELFGADESFGYLADASGGTLILDEIAQVTVDVRQRLARALETDRGDLRIIGTTSAGASRIHELGDHFAWLELALPPLRAHAGDIPLLVEAMLAAHGDKRVSADAWRELTAYSWPGNLRELHDAVARAVKRGGDVLEPRDFFPGTRRELAIADEVEKSPRSTLVDRRWRRSSRPRGLEEQDAE